MENGVNTISSVGNSHKYYSNMSPLVHNGAIQHQHHNNIANSNDNNTTNNRNNITNNNNNNNQLSLAENPNMGMNNGIGGGTNGISGSAGTNGNANTNIANNNSNNNANSNDNNSNHANNAGNANSNNTDDTNNNTNRWSSDQQPNSAILQTANTGINATTDRPAYAHSHHGDNMGPPANGMFNHFQNAQNPWYFNNIPQCYQRLYADNCITFATNGLQNQAQINSEHGGQINQFYHHHQQQQGAFRLTLRIYN